MKFVLALLALSAVASLAAVVNPLQDAEYELLFSKWAAQHSRQYESVEETMTRFAIFKDNLDYIRLHETLGKNHTLKMNKFGDMTNEEFVATYTGLNPTVRPSNIARRHRHIDVSALPASVDWNAAGKVTAVKNQEQCGSCWAFSTTGSTEAAYAIENSASPISLSEQQLVDCSDSYGNEGCNGGLMDQAFEYIIANGGLCTEQAYPYTAQDGTCQTTCTNTVTISAYTDVTVNSEDALQTAVAQQPVSVAVDAAGLDWQFYSGGIVSDACGTSLDHGVLAAGYGTSSGTAYWYVKNSWGADWGAAGYIMLKRGTGSGQPGECGIAMDPSYPTGASLVNGAKHRHTRH